MSDPLSMASAVAGLVSLADVVLTKTYRYVSAVKSAEKNIKELLKLLEAMYGTMTVLKTRIRVLDSLSTSSSSLYTRPGVMDDCSRLLDDINQKLASYELSKNTSKVEQHLRKLRWPFEASQTKEIVEQLGRFNQVLLMALQGDTLSAVYETFRAASDIRDDIKRLERSLGVKMNNLIDFELGKAQQEAFNHYNCCDPTSRHDVARRLCQQGTGKWFTEGSVFADWSEGSRTKLWLSGIPGAGKTVLASSIIQRARLHVARIAEPTALVYFYCDYKDPQTHEVHNILTNFTAQLARQSSSAMDFLLHQYTKFHKPGRASTLDEPPELIDTVQSLCAYFQCVFFVIDGLDECGQNVAKVTKALQKIANTTNTKVRCILLSRAEFDIERILLTDFEEIRIAAQSYDLKLFVHSCLEDIDDDDPAFREQILQRLVQKADGMFRWVACQIDYLRDLPSSEERRKALNELPPDLKSSYDRILERLNQKPSSTQELVHLTLTWLILGKEVDMSFAALREALSVRFGQSRLQRDKIPNEQTILRHCSSFVRRSADGDCIELAHFTVAEYLTQIPVSHQTLSPYRVDEREGMALLAINCLTYLKFEDFGDIASITDVQKRSKDYKFRMHAVEQWAEYARSALADTTCYAMAKEFCDDISTAKALMWLYDYVWCALEPYFDIYADYADNEGVGINDYIQKVILEKMKSWAPIHCASLLNLSDIVDNLCQKGTDVNAMSGAGTPTHLVLVGHFAFTAEDINDLEDLFDSGTKYKTFQHLFDAGADPSIAWQTEEMLQPISVLNLVLINYDETQYLACYIALLLKAGLRLNHQTIKEAGSYGFHRALYALFPETIKLEHIQSDYRAEWIDAVRQDSEEHLCISTPILLDTNQRDVLHALIRRAAQANQVAVLSDLLHREGIDINAIGGEEGESPLIVATKNGSLQTARLLIDHGADCNLYDNYGLDAWYYAAEGGYVDILKSLKAQFEGSDDAFCNMLSKQHSALFAAAEAGKGEAVLFLIQTPGAIAVHDAAGRNLAHYSAYLQTEVLEELISLGLDFTQKDHHHNTALHTFCEEGCSKPWSTRNIKFLLQYGHQETKECAGRHNWLLTQLNHLIDSNMNADSLRSRESVKLECHIDTSCAGITLNSINASGYTPLDLLLFHHWSSPGYFDQCFDFLTSCQARPASKKTCDTWKASLFCKHDSDDQRCATVFTKILDAWSKTNFPELQDFAEDAGLGAAKCGNSVLLGRALDVGIDVLKVNPVISESSVLESVCRSQHDVEIVERVFQELRPGSIAQAKLEEKFLLHLACAKDSRSSPAVVTELLKKGWNVNEQEITVGHTPLMKAAANAKDEHMHILLEAGAEVKLHDRYGWTVFIYAINSSSIPCVALLAEQFSAEPLWWSSFSFSIVGSAHQKAFVVTGSNILHFACAQQSVRILEFILDRWPSTNLNQVTSEQLTPLHIGCVAQSQNTFDFLIERKVKLGEQDVTGCTPLHLAASRANTDIIRALCEHGADVNILDKYGNTPLHSAAAGGFQSSVEYLLSKGARSMRNREGSTPEILAQLAGHNSLVGLISGSYCRELGKLHSRQQMPLLANLTKSTDVEETMRSELRRLKIYDVFVKAIKRGDNKVVADLTNHVDTKADPPCSGCTPISAAVCSGRTKLLHDLLNLGHTTNSYGCICNKKPPLSTMQLAAGILKTDAMIHRVFSASHVEDQQRPLISSHHPVIVAATRNNSSYLDFFLKQYCPHLSEVPALLQLIRVESPIDNERYRRLSIEPFLSPYNNNGGANVLHVASAYNSIDIVKLISLYPMLIDATDNGFATPLHFAAVNGGPELIHLLLNSGADINARTGRGITPLLVAIIRHRKEVVELLLQRGARTHLSNVQLHYGAFMLNAGPSRETLLAHEKFICDLNTPTLSSNSHLIRPTSLCFTSDVFLSTFKTQSRAFGYYILHNGKHLLKHILKRLKLCGILSKQLEYNNPSALCLAAQLGDPEIVNALIDYGADMNAIGCDEGSALTLACKINRLEVIKLLVRRGARMTCINIDDKKISCFETAKSHPEMLQWLLVRRFNDQLRLECCKDEGESLQEHVSIKPWSGLHEVRARLPPEFKQARGDTLLQWHIRKRRDLRSYQGKVLRHGPDIEYPFINYK